MGFPRCSQSSRWHLPRRPRRRNAGKRLSPTGATARSATSTRSAATGRRSRTCPKTFVSYSSASDDINRALSGRVVGRSLAGSSATALPSRPPLRRSRPTASSGTPLVLFGSLAALLLLGGAAGLLHAEEMERRRTPPCAERLMTLLRCATLAAVVVAVAGFVTPTAGAASGAKFGIHDDAWLLSGPGSLTERTAELDRIGVDIVRFTLRWDQIAVREPRDPTDNRDRAYRWRNPDRVLTALNRRGIAAVVTLVGTPSWANGGFDASWAPDIADGVRRLRLRRGEPLPVRPPLDDLERAQPGAVAEAHHAADLREPAAQPGVRGDQAGSSRGARRRWRHGAARECGRPVSTRLDRRHGPGQRQARRLRAPPVSGAAADGNALERRVQALPDDLDGLARAVDRCRPQVAGAEAHLADRVRLPDEPARHLARHRAGAAGRSTRPRQRSECGRRPTSTC